MCNLPKPAPRWVVQCECGSEPFELANFQLKEGYGGKKSCGCYYTDRRAFKSPRLKDLTGKRFNMLTVIERVENSKFGQARWKVQCDCGSEPFITDTGHLNGNKSQKGMKSCGCVRHNTPDYTGQRFGRLVVTGMGKQRTRGFYKSQGRMKEFYVYECYVKCDCGTEKIVPHVQFHGKKKTQSCGCLAVETTIAKNKARVYPTGPDHPLWKGGRLVGTDGYVYIYKPDHPQCTKAGYVNEHRLVMERHIGRYLKPYPGETVHHLYGPRDSNDIKNLELWTGNHPAGVRVKDLDKWVDEYILEREKIHPNPNQLGIFND
jgi:hypothetical protein